MARNSLKSVIKAIERANANIPVEQQFLDDLKRSIEIDDAKNARKPSETYSPSAMGCLRAMYYKRIGADAPYQSTYTMVGICESGTDRHERIQNAISRMKENGFDCEYVDVADFVKQRGLDAYLDIVDKCGNETKLYDRNRHISFLCDGIIRYQGIYYIVEFKTEASFKWKDRKDVDPKHHNQAITYSLELQLDNVLFVYINRDICDYKAYMFNVTEHDRQLVRDLIDVCEVFVQHKEVPPMPENINPKVCAYCAYKSLCDRNSNGKE